MAMIKLFSDRYINSDMIHELYLEKEENVWNVLVFPSGIKSDSKPTWMGQFDTREEAEKAVDKMFQALGIIVYEFVPDYN